MNITEPSANVLVVECSSEIEGHSILFMLGELIASKSIFELRGLVIYVGFYLGGETYPIRINGMPELISSIKAKIERISKGDN